MPVYPEAPGRWRIRIWFRGARLPDIIVEGTKAEARATEARRRAAVEAQGRGAPTAAPTFSDFCLTRYRDHASAHLRGSTWNRRKYQIATLIETFGDLRLTDVTEETIDAYQQARVMAGRMPRTVNNEVKCLLAILSYARRMKIPATHPRVRMLRTAKGRHAKAWSPEQLDRLYSAVRLYAPTLLPLVVFIVNTGVRKGEALACEWTWIDLARRVIRIEPNEEWQPKDGEPREVPIPDALVPWLTMPRASERWVFPCETGGKYAYWPKAAWYRAVRAAELTGGPHVLRHTFASMFLEAEPDLGLLARILGHSTTAVTETYQHFLPARLERARRAVNVEVPILAAVGSGLETVRETVREAPTLRLGSDVAMAVIPPETTAFPASRGEWIRTTDPQTPSFGAHTKALENRGSQRGKPSVKPGAPDGTVRETVRAPCDEGFALLGAGEPS